jgi:hypothetical protein
MYAERGFESSCGGFAKAGTGRAHGSRHTRMSILRQWLYFLMFVRTLEALRRSR